MAGIINDGRENSRRAARKAFREDIDGKQEMSVNPERLSDHRMEQLRDEYREEGASKPGEERSRLPLAQQVPTEESRGGEPPRYHEGGRWENRAIDKIKAALHKSSEGT